MLWKSNNLSAAFCFNSYNAEIFVYKPASNDEKILLERDMAQWLEQGALSMSLSAVGFRISFGAGFSQKYHVSPLLILKHWFDVVSLGKALYPQMLHLTLVKMSRTEMAMCMISQNTPKWLHDYMLSVENEQVQWPGGKKVKVGWNNWYQTINLHLLPYWKHTPKSFKLKKNVYVRFRQSRWYKGNFNFSKVFFNPE